MWGGARRDRLLIIVPVFVFTCCGGGCGGGAGGGVQPPPLIEDFAIHLSTSSATITQGDSSAPISVSITPLNGFSGDVSVALSGLPAGLTSNPASPFSVSTSQSISVILGAASDAPVGQFSISALATSGTLSHAAPLSLTVQSGVALNLSRSAYVRTDSVVLLDAPPGEPHRRHIVFDAAGDRFFVANQAMNRVDVVSASSSALLASIDVPAATSVDLSTDGSTLWVGTALEQLLAIDTHSLQVKQRIPVAGLIPIPGVVFNRPVELVTAPGGKLWVRLRQPAVAQSLLAFWDPATNIFTNLTPSAPAIFQKGLGVKARSGDSRFVFAGANDTSGEAVLLDSFGNVVAGPQVLGAGTITFGALNADGSHAAALLSTGSAQQLLLLDARLNLLASYSTSGATSVLFSRDGQTIYLAEALGNGRVITALSASNLQIAGQIPDLPVAGVPSVLEAVDSGELLCALSNRGVSFLDASQFVTLTAPAPLFAGAPVALPAEGANSGGTAVTLSGTDFSGNATVRYGSQNAVTAGNVSSSQLQSASPATHVHPERMRVSEERSPVF